ncbi:hypothetical protein SAPIO_CDS2064 [Scedosporium apiospermum]|uniref:Uncharacterized protein n=1 Tax=Pseudallescheria apiosperma TaxID=563466 RepID=A0A084GD61_PSEDA|nr:uncharacterized protein SAPIO_CDS2064 [Scedosporium apiospermum]KEZ45273.1 hypothetical protein SAPIO_CDS2064 [Scedosporium apiospermum]
MTSSFSSSPLPAAPTHRKPHQETSLHQKASQASPPCHSSHSHPPASAQAAASPASPPSSSPSSDTASSPTQLAAVYIYSHDNVAVSDPSTHGTYDESAPSLCGDASSYKYVYSMAEAEVEDEDDEEGGEEEAEDPGYCCFGGGCAAEERLAGFGWVGWEGWKLEGWREID